MADERAGGDPAHVYVYYEVAGSPAAARDAVAQLMAAVERDTGISGRLLCRCGGERTWLEVYEPVPHRGPFLAVLAAHVQRHGLDRHAVEGRRHVECFIALPPAGAPLRT